MLPRKLLLCNSAITIFQQSATSKMTYKFFAKSEQSSEISQTVVLSKFYVLRNSWVFTKFCFPDNFAKFCRIFFAILDWSQFLILSRRSAFQQLFTYKLDELVSSAGASATLVRTSAIDSAVRNIAEVWTKIAECPLLTNTNIEFICTLSNKGIFKEERTLASKNNHRHLHAPYSASNKSTDEIYYFL